MTKQKIGILGGAFDPIHFGHLQLAQACCEALALDEVRFLPCLLPVHKMASQAKPWQRAAMVALAIVNFPLFKLDTRELIRNTPSYAITTLESFKEEYGDSVELYWIMGMDAFQEIETWHRWQELAFYCNLAVASREITKDNSAHRAMIEATFEKHGHRVIDIVMPLHVAASRHIRETLYADYHAKLTDVPPEVLQFIHENNLFNK